MFGGSTLWGYGARDEFTIPSLVSKKLAARVPTAPWVVNLGETGYVTTQEVITLMLELRKGNVPDLAVFYDGVNDAWAAFQSGVAGMPQNELNRIIEFNSRERLNLRGGFVQKSGLYRFARGLSGSIGSGGVGAASRRRFLDPALANAVVDTYVGNVRLVKALARDYGFQVVFFWQPTIYSKKILSPDEERWRLTGSRRQGAPAFAEEYRAFNEAFKQRMKSARIDDVYDLSDTFANEARTIYIDRFHMSEIGNNAVAEAMVATLERIGTRIGR
jgi:lysophospholipase L1-like esterase